MPNTNHWLSYSCNMRISSTQTHYKNRKKRSQTSRRNQKGLISSRIAPLLTQRKQKLVRIVHKSKALGSTVAQQKLLGSEVTEWHHFTVTKVGRWWCKGKTKEKSSSNGIVWIRQALQRHQWKILVAAIWTAIIIIPLEHIHPGVSRRHSQSNTTSTPYCSRTKGGGWACELREPDTQLLRFVKAQPPPCPYCPNF